MRCYQDNQRRQLIVESRRYAWWLGKRSRPVRNLQKYLGWRLSELTYRLLRRPSGALTWPLGLALLCLNAAPENARQDLPWIRQCFDDLIGPQGESWLPPAAIDQGGLGYAALRLHRLTGGEHYLHFAQALGDWLSSQPGAEDGHIPYTVGHRLVLVDTVGMICPFLARLALSSGNIRYRQIALAQLEAIWQVGDTDRGWTYHAFDADSLQPVGMRGWGRGIGWLLLGIVDTLCELESSPERDQWLSRGEKLLAALQACQCSDGHWPWRFDDPKAPPDSSVTALVAYCLARWRQMIGAHPFSHMEKFAIDALTTATDKQGHIGGGSGEAGGVGNYSPSFGNYLWTQGPAVARHFDTYSM